MTAVCEHQWYAFDADDEKVWWTCFLKCGAEKTTRAPYPIDANELRDRIMSVNAQSIAKLNASYADDSITSGEEFGHANYSRGLQDALDAINQMPRLEP